MRAPINRRTRTGATGLQQIGNPAQPRASKGVQTRSNAPCLRSCNDMDSRVNAISPAVAGPEALSSWMNTLVDYVRSGEPDLTNRQMALLMLVYLQPGPHTVRGLARALNVSKPVVTRALNRLGTLGYLRRQRDDSDKRNIFVTRTPEGADFLAEFGHFLDAEPAFAGRGAHGTA
jgi:DNA-binding MarR family transcriptional regulator